MAISIIETGEHIDLLFSDVLMQGNIDADAAKDKEHPFPLIRKPYTIDILAKQIRTTLLK